MSFYSFNHQIELIDHSQSWQQQRSFLYGDGHFTTAKIQCGKIALWPRHQARLQETHKKLRLNPIDWPKLFIKLEELSLKIDLGVLKIQIDRGQAVRGYGNTINAKPNVFVWVIEQNSPISNFPVELEIADTTLGHNPLLAGLKHTNRLEQALIANELEHRGLVDAIVCDYKHNIIETNKANVFWCEDGQWFTPAIRYCGVNGTMRQEVLAQLADVRVVERGVKEVALRAQAMFIANALMGLTPVQALAGRKLNVAMANQCIQKVIL